jgi:hypothetical protein
VNGPTGSEGDPGQEVLHVDRLARGPRRRRRADSVRGNEADGTAMGRRDRREVHRRGRGRAAPSPSAPARDRQAPRATRSSGSSDRPGHRRSRPGATAAGVRSSCSGRPPASRPRMRSVRRPR